MAMSEINTAPRNEIREKRANDARDAPRDSTSRRPPRERLLLRVTVPRGRSARYKF